MPRMPLMLGLLLSGAFACAPLPAHEGEDHAAPASESVPAEARDAAATVDAFGAALKAGDLDSVRRLLDPAVQVYESGHVEDGREAYFAEHAAADASFLASARITRESRHAGASADSAWVATRATLERTAADGSAKRYASLETMALRRGAEGWRIVHIHWSSRELPAGG